MGLSNIKRLRTELSVKRFVSSKQVGRDKRFVEAYEILKDEFDRALEEGETYYYYIGPDDEKTRDFCKYMLKLDKVFSSDEILFMSERLGYSVAQYKGSYNCRHRWVRFRGKFILTPAPTNRQIENLIERNINY